MPKQLRKFLLLMWKNWLVLRRHLCRLICEILYVAIIILFMYFHRTRYPFDVVNNPGYPNEPSFDSLSQCNEYKDDDDNRNVFAYSPTSPLLNQIAFGSCDSEHVTISEFDSKAELEKKINTDLDFVATLLVALEFSDNLRGVNESKDVPKETQVTIRFPYRGDISTKWNTDRLYPYYQDIVHGSGGYEKYMLNNFYRLQNHIIFGLIYDAYLNFTIRMNKRVFTGTYPEAPFIQDVFFARPDTESTFMFITFSLFMFNYLVTVKTIASEKESQLKESMKIMGLPGWLQWLCWFLQALIFNIIYITVTLIVAIQIYPPIFAFSNGFILFLFYVLYACSLISLAFLISTLLAKATPAVIIGSMVYWFVTVPYFMRSTTHEGKTPSAVIVLLTSLLCSSGFGFGVQIIFIYEKFHQGVNWNNIGTNPMPYNVSLQDIMLMLLTDTILYMCLAWYIEQVYPGNYGIPQRWYFLCTPSYWCSKRIKSKIEDRELPSRSDQRSFEQITENRPVGIQIDYLSKTFGHYEAVKNLNLEVYQGYLTVLVGHNGDGKTTTLNMITGMIPPSTGTVLVNGYDVTKDVGNARDSMGLCLEHNVLIKELTVAEHLYFFGTLKGLNTAEVKRETGIYLEKLQLEDKRKSFPKALSGGMKRKLSVAIALCGRSKVVILDEPTKGMDPSARREVWDLLQQIKGGRTILLTTHYMDEADVLGDRVAIMAGGEVQCYGSSFFLKQKFKIGYYLVLEVTPRCQPHKITDLLKNYITNVQLVSHVGSELSYHLPGNESQKFEAMLRALESNFAALEIRSFGISAASLEDVFLKVGSDSKKENETRKQKRDINEPQKEYFSGLPLIVNQIIAMFLKRSLSALRRWPLLLIQIFLPGILLLLPVVLLSVPRTVIEKDEKDWPPLNLTLDLYPTPIIVLSGDNSVDTYRMYKELLKGHQVVEVDDFESEIMKQEILSRDTVNMHYIVGASFNSTTSIAWFNDKLIHSAPISYSLVLNTLYHVLFDNRSISFVNHPLPKTIADEPEDLHFETDTSEGAYLSIALLLFALIVAVPLVIFFYINERASGNKYLQVVSGVNIFIFWLTSLLWDLAVFFLMLCVILVAILIESEFLRSLLGCLSVLLIAFFFYVLALTYLLSNIVSSPTFGFILFFVFGIVTGPVGTLLFILLGPYGHKFVPLLILTPFGSLSLGIFALLQQEYYKKMEICYRPSPEETCEKLAACCDLDNCYASTQYRIGNNVKYSFIMFFVLFVVLILHEYGLFTYLVNKLFQNSEPLKTPANVDSDVQDETNIIKNTPENTLRDTYVLVLRDLTKYYGTHSAVKGISLTVKSTECFGLMGENGAGKTTTFKMITGETSISYGDAIVNGLSIRKKKKTVQKQIGYCPQFDALLENLTPRETIKIFALLRGVSWKNCKPLVENLAEDFDFSKHLDKEIRILSGGNKRKVSAALAVIGESPLIYLDEPSNGIDPGAKRYLWSTLGRLREGGKCLILTSQSMEEAEALCTRVAIMVNGRFQCLGSIQRLKNRFAQACSLKIKMKRPVDERQIEVMDNFVKKNFPKVELKERFQEMLSYEFEGSMAWSRMFGIMERNKSALRIEEYALGQCSLEQVFLNFVKHQK